MITYHTQSLDHNSSPAPLLLTSWLLLATVLLVSMVKPNNKQSLLVQYTISLYSIIPYTATHMRGKTFAVYHSIFPQIVALSIGNISLQTCYSKIVSANNYFPLETRKFSSSKVLLIPFLNTYNNIYPNKENLRMS